MKRSAVVLLILLVLTQMLAGSGPQAPNASANASVLDELVGLERGALDRWIRGDPQGYIDLFANDITYFDPFRESRLDGIDAFKKMVADMPKAPGSLSETRYEMIEPKVQQYGDVAILTFRVISYGKMDGKAEGVLARWNSTETYRRTTGKQWKVVHSHWSYTTPAIKVPGS